MRMVLIKILAEPSLVDQVESIQCKWIDSFQSKACIDVLQVKMMATNRWV